MSYSIEYDRQFIKSEKGITACILCGDNNVYEANNRRRARSWSVFGGLLGATKEDFLRLVEPSLNGYQQHWQKNGKWLDDAALLRWIDSGCKHAASIEDILSANRKSAVRCYLWNYGQPEVLDTYISGTAEFDQWIERANAYRSVASGYFPIIALAYNEPIKHPRHGFSDSDEVFLKSGKSYVTEIKMNDEGYSYSMDSDPRTALRLMHLDAQSIVRRCSAAKFSEVSANVAKGYEPAVIQLSDGRYIYKIANGRVYLTPHKDCAHKYKNTSAAYRVIGSNATLKNVCSQKNWIAQPIAL